MPSRTELVAHGRDTDAIAEAIGADLVIFQTLHDLVTAVRQFNREIPSFDCSVFTGEYVTGGVDEPYLQYLENLRADNVKNKAQANGIGSLEGKGGGAVFRNGVNGHTSGPGEPQPGYGGLTHGADDTVGLHNSWIASR